MQRWLGSDLIVLCYEKQQVLSAQYRLLVDEEGAMTKEDLLNALDRFSLVRLVDSLIALGLTRAFGRECVALLECPRFYVNTESY